MNKPSALEWIKVILSAVCAVALVVNTVLLWRVSSNSLSEPSENGNTQSSATTQSTVDTKMKEITTAYGVIQFPQNLAEHLVHEEIETTDSVEDVFYCQMGQEKIELYRIVFGEPQRENFIGYLEYDGVRIPVTVGMSEITLEGRSSEQQELLYAMSATLNQVLVSIAEWDFFVYE